VSLFKTFWTIHSGEIFGIPGQLLVDAAGLVFIFLSLTGILYFFIPGLIRRRKARSAGFGRLRGLRRWSLRWHNKIGWMTLPILLVTASTGMFLRPPLLIPIAGAYVPPIPCTLLDGSNAWEDQLRRIIFDHERGRYMVATIKGVYEVMPGLDQPPVRIPGAPPISVMGVNVFEAPAPGWLLVGSFEGLFLWHPESGYIHDYIRDRQYERRVPDGNPVGEFLVAGFSRDLNGIEVVFDYDRGSLVLGSMDYLPAMPPEIRDQPISLWNLALEVHTARIYQVLIGPFYLLLIPLIGLFTLFILISGFIVWYRHHRRRPPQVGMSQGK